MTFTYTDALSTDRDKVRFSVQDTTANSGPLPADANFSDAEIDGLVTLEGTWQRATAAVFEALAAAWARHVNFSADGASVSQGAIAAHYREQAEKWRQLYGYGGTTSVGTVAVTRVDGYSHDIENDDTDEVTTISDLLDSWS